MTSLPHPLKLFSKEAYSLLTSGKLGEMEFSGGTYQVQVIDPDSGEDVWAFLQYDDKNRLKDYFCSCEEGGDLGACVHLAAAYLKIFSHPEKPLHVRFQDSLWNKLCFFFCEEYGDDPELLLKNGAEFTLSLPEKGAVFAAKGITDSGTKHLEKIFYHRLKETEETSLKFSNLSEEEIRLWKQGRPSAHLKYELSFWNDLAKWLMILQDSEEECSINFSYSPQKIPNHLSVKFTEVSLEFLLTRECLNAIIASLSTVNSPLNVFGRPEEEIASITYDKQRGELTIHAVPSSLNDQKFLEKDTVIIGDWIYFVKTGFYPRERHVLLKELVYRGGEIGKVFDNYYTIIKSKLKGFPILDKPTPVSYSLSFDSDWSLHINAFLFKKEDLKRKDSKLLGDWAFLEGEGFVHLEGMIFDTIETIIPEQKVGDFIREYRSWLNTQEGFHTHITGVETKLTYSMAEDGSLLFTRMAVFEDETLLAKDFGQWVYVRGEGFFSKVSANMGMPIRSGVSIKADQVPMFIRMYREELALIKGFFSDRSPVKKAGLILELTPLETVAIRPEYEINPAYIGKEIVFYDEYSYVKGEGFHRLPAQILLPERFRHPIELEKDNLPRFFAYELDQLKEYALKIDPRLIPPTDLRLVADTLFEETEGYLLQLHYESQGAAVKLSELWKAVQNKERFVFSEVGLIDLEKGRFNWISKVSKSQLDRRSNKLSLSTLELLRLHALDPLYVIEGDKLLRELIELRTPEEPDLTDLKSHLRPYQEIGLRWMWFLYYHNLSGLLCDDMGLGKTHQAMALMAAISQKKGKKVHFLVVCPTSVIYHWEEKLGEFLPHAKVCTFHGSKRSFDDFHEEYDILLTSYGIWRNENILLSQSAFEVAIFDEIQAAKNQTSRIHASLLKVKAKVRIGLTGTPIENRLRELKALFDIILPRYMPHEAEYREFFVVPIERENNQERKNLLSRFIKPFVLRRKKEDVLPDLPEKTEEVAHCELSLDQKLLYNDVLKRVREGIYRELEDKENPIPYIHIFSALSSLKQICNHPAAFLKNPEQFKIYSSGKWDLFTELLSEALESGQKVVIFSQYLAMLDIFEQYLKESEIRYATIRGATLKRGEEIRKFNLDPQCEVFIGSLHAAGLGIDLTAGSVVIHYDRWWNAAREDQATDRVHRIGQVRGVQVFKLVTKGTFEERIDEMIARKGKLMEEVVGVDDYRFMKQFDREEIMQLFVSV